MSCRDDIVRSARSYVGVRRRHQGRDRSGLDCIGLLMAVAKDIGYREIENPTDYMRTIDPLRFMAKLHEYTDAGARSRIRNGSIGLFKQAMAPIHCGLFVFQGSQLNLIHAEINKRAIVEEPANAWMHELVEVREYRGIR